MKKLSFILIMMFIISFVGCGIPNDSTNTSQDSVELSELSPEKILETALSALKNEDGKTFNSCVVYQDEKHHNVYFGDDLSDDDGYIKALFENLSYEILEEEEPTDSTAVISCKISNRDLKSLDMDRYSDSDNPMVAAIQNANTEIISKTIDITMKRDNKQWKIMIDNDFTNAISGGHW